MKRAGPWAFALLVGLMVVASGPASAQEAAPETDPPGMSLRPRLRPPGLAEGFVLTGPETTDDESLPIIAPSPVDPSGSGPAASVAATTPALEAPTQRDPAKGVVTNLPIPRYVSLKGGEGNARRGPGLTNRIDWVFTTSGMPLRITAEHENWRRVEDSEGLGGWVHYSLLSGVRTVLVTVDMAEFFTKPDPKSGVAFQAEMGVIGRLIECQPDWCRVNVQGEKGWLQKSSLWGVDPNEVLE